MFTANISRLTIMTMKFSIIIPAYNEEKRLPGCLESIQNLDYPSEDREVIVVDNGSTDSTRDIAALYGAKVLVDDTKNVSGLRNLGMSHAGGEILAFIDADCVAGKSWLKNAGIYVDMMDIAAWGAPPALPKESTWVQRTWYLVRQKEKMVQEVDWLETMNLFVRKDHFTGIGGFNEGLVTCEDVDFCYRIRKYGKIISDSRLEVIHLGEAKTLKEFMKKEIWRGKSNLSGLRSHGFSLKELPSLSIPLYFGVFLPLSFLGSVIFKSPVWFIANLGFYLLPSVVVIFKVRQKDINFSALLRLLFLIQVYFFSRTVAVARG